MVIRITYIDNHCLRYEDFSEWDTLAHDKIIKINCLGNIITSLPSLPSLSECKQLFLWIELYCWDNNFNKLPSLSECEQLFLWIKLFCRNNKLTSLHSLSECKQLFL